MKNVLKTLYKLIRVPNLTTMISIRVYTFQSNRVTEILISSLVISIGKLVFDKWTKLIGRSAREGKTE